MSTLRRSRPGRALVALVIVVAVLAAGMLTSRATKPKLAIDLAGGTSITLTARANRSRQVTADAMNQTVEMIRNRVNSTGVAEAEVVRQGTDQIIVTVAGRYDPRLANLVGETALLRFRPVLAQGPPNRLPTKMPVLRLPGVQARVVRRFERLDCAVPRGQQRNDRARPAAAVVACDRSGTAKYILGPAVVEGTDVSTAQAGLPTSGTGAWRVDLGFDGTGTRGFATITRRVVDLPPPRDEVAIVLDGVVISAPRIVQPITGGQAQITGTFSRAEATDLARVLTYGALPLAFDKSQVTSISPTLGAGQLHAGLLAGAIGFGLVFLYCLAYYRRLGVLAGASLVVAAALVYATLCLLGAAMGYRLSLAGIAGIIVAVGITADSFVVLFERFRDELRDGRTPRTAVDYAWQRARRTILVADTVSFLAAAVLYLVSADQVKGFAFTLGLTTMIDVCVVVLFTKPMLVLAARHQLVRGWVGRFGAADGDAAGVRSLPERSG